MAQDELRRALELPYRALAKIVPWGDDFEGISPNGRNVRVERNYIWKDAQGADILAEVHVHVNAPLYDLGERASAVIAQG